MDQRIDWTQQFTRGTWSNPRTTTTWTYLPVGTVTGIHLCTGFDVQTASWTRGFIGAEVNLLIASSVSGNGALFEKGRGGVELDNEAASKQQGSAYIHDVVANRDRIAYVIGITRELISSPFDPPTRDDWLTSARQHPYRNIPNNERTRYSLEKGVVTCSREICARWWRERIVFVHF